MKSLIAGALTTAMLATGSTVVAAQHTLPDDSTEPVITMDYLGSRMQRVDTAPALSILADGTVLMPRLYANSQAYESRITTDELQRLLAFIIDDHRFFEIDAAAASATITSDSRRPLPVHSSTTVIRVTADNRTEEISVRGLGHGPAAPETQDLLAVKQRLNQLMSVVKLGGPDEVAQLLDLANEELQTSTPGAAPLTSEDLYSGGRRSDGSFSVWFKRHDPEAVTNVTIEVTADGQRFVTAAQEVL